MLRKIYSLQNLHRYQEAPTIAPPFTNQNMHSLYAIRQNMKPLPSFLPQLPSPERQQQQQQQQLDSVYGNKISKIKQSQKITKNVNVTPQVGLIVPDHSYQLSDINNNEVGEQKSQLLN